MAALITLAAIAFVSTNLDDLVVLLALFSDPTQRPRDVWAGQFLGMFTLTLVAVTCALAAASVPSPYVGLLGFLPLLIGLTRLVSRRGAREPNAPNAKKGSAENVFVAAAVTAANGGDNIAVYVPLLVGRSWPEITVIALVFSILTAIWCTVARDRKTTTHRSHGHAAWTSMPTLVPDSAWSLHLDRKPGARHSGSVIRRSVHGSRRDQRGDVSQGAASPFQVHLR